MPGAGLLHLMRQPPAGCGPASRLRHAGQNEEEAAADGLDVFLQRLAIKAPLHGQEALLQVGLETDEQQPHVQLAGTGHAVGVVVATAQHQIALPGMGAGCGIGQANMRIQRRPLAVGIVPVIR